MSESQEKVKIGKRLPQGLVDAGVLSEDGGAMRLGDFMEKSPERPVLFVFIRHFGCLGCSMHMQDLAPRVEELNDLGLNLVLVGNGEARHIAGFFQRYKLNRDHVNVVTDPSLKAYEAAGFKRSILRTLGFKGIFDQLKALVSGHSQDGIKGDNWQQGGAILVDSDDTVVFYHQNETVGDFVPTFKLVDACYSLLSRKDPLLSGSE